MVRQIGKGLFTANVNMLDVGKGVSIPFSMATANNLSAFASKVRIVDLSTATLNTLSLLANKLRRIVNMPKVGASKVTPSLEASKVAIDLSGEVSQ